MKSLVDNNYFVIFCQAPVPDFHNFWQAVYHKDVNMIIMLCMFLDPRRGVLFFSNLATSRSVLAWARQITKVQRTRDKNSLTTKIGYRFCKERFFSDRGLGIEKSLALPRISNLILVDRVVWHEGTCWKHSSHPVKTCVDCYWTGW